MSEKISPSNHPLIAHKLTRMRTDDLLPHEFKRLMREVAMLLAYEVTSDFEIDQFDVVDRKGKTRGSRLRGEQPVIVPILRSGLVMAEGFQEIIPRSSSGHIGLHKDKTTASLTQYFVSLPRGNDRTFVVLDPVIATGDTSIRSVSALKEKGVNGGNIRFVSIVTSLYGLNSLSQKHPDIRIYYAALDSFSDHNNGIIEGLNRKFEVVPGIGSVSDRLFGFKTL